MRCIYVDRMDDGRISVRIAAGITPAKKRIFDDRDEAVRFAGSKMGRKGVMIDTTLMSPKQRAIHKAREVGAAALIAQMEKEAEG